MFPKLFISGKKGNIKNHHGRLLQKLPHCYEHELSPHKKDSSLCYSVKNYILFHWEHDIETTTGFHSPKIMSRHQKYRQYTTQNTDSHNATLSYESITSKSPGMPSQGRVMHSEYLSYLKGINGPAPPCTSLGQPCVCARVPSKPQWGVDYSKTSPFTYIYRQSEGRKWWMHEWWT